MFILITGGSGSGKSAYAEEIITGLQKEQLYYLATMNQVGRESLDKIERHRRMRRGKGFQTIERYTDLKNLIIPKGTAILLECMSNLLANEMYQEDGAKEAAVEEILVGVKHVRKQTAHLVIVTNEVFSDGRMYEESTRKYMKSLGYLNAELGRQADCLVEVVYSIPVIQKGADKL